MLHNPGSAARRGSLVCVCLAAVLSAAPATLWAACLPLPSEDLHRLDDYAVRHPEAGLEAAQTRLESLGGHADSEYQAELYAIVAATNADLDRSDRAETAIAAGLARLDAAVDTSAARRVRLRLDLLRADIATVSADSAAAGAAIDKMLVAVPDNSLERACVLSERAIAYDFNNQPDRAVAVALEVHRLAEVHGWSEARLESAYTLAVNFRRAGLNDHAQRMIDEVIALEKSLGLVRSLSYSEYERSKLLVAEHQLPAARAAAERARTYAIDSGDRLAAASANLPLCLAELDGRDLAAAAVTCDRGDADFIAGRRADLAALMRSYRARLELERNRPAAALAILNDILSEPVHRLLPIQEPQIYRDRGRAYSLMHRFPEAYADVQRAADLDLAAGLELRNAQVAVLGAVIAADELTAANRLLEERMIHQQGDLARHKQARLLWATLAAAAAVLCALLAYLLVLGRRHTRRLRRYEVILRSSSMRAQDSIFLLDERRNVCFANRPLCGASPSPVVGMPMAAATPPALLPQLSAAIDEAFESRSPVNIDAEVTDASGTVRRYELSILPALDGNDALGVTLRSTDVTDMRALEREMLDGASLERQHLGSALHEGLGQQLAGISFMLGNLSTVLKRGHAGAHRLVHEIAEHVAHSIESARLLAQGLAPVTIHSGSIGGALDSLAHDAAQRLHIEVSIDCQVDKNALSDVVADHLFRICREAITNAALHGRCARAHITARVLRDMLELRIADDGAGLGAADAPTGGFGMKMMAYRARLLGGAVRFHTASTGGTCVVVTVPLAHLRNPIELA